MFSSRLAPLLALVLFLAPSLRAENAGQPTLLGEADYKSFHVEGSEYEKVEFTIQPAGELGYTSTLLLKTKEACSSSYAAQIGQRNREAIHKGDVVLVHFFLRTLQSSLESGEGLTEIIVENSESYSKCLQFGASALKEWREFFVPFVADTDYAPGHASIILRMGYQPQTIELAGLTLKNLGPKDALADSPTGLAKLKYAGQEADAPWRAEAERRIDQIRKASFTIQVVDESGQPVPGAELAVRQTKHAYWFGSAVRSDHIMSKDDPKEQARYRAALMEMFNVVTFENELKWPFWKRDLAASTASLQWLSEQGIALRGHVMVWPSHLKGLPEPLYPLMDKPDKLRQAILDHIREITALVQPPAAAWDVVNETFNNHEFMDVLGREAMVAWFEAAHQGTPQSRLFINDWGIVTSRGTDQTHQNDYEKTIAYLLENKAPLDGIGVQGHFGREPTPPDRLLEVLNRFGQFGKEIQMTEYSTQFSDPKDAAAYLGDCLTLFFSQPATTGFILWGFKDGVGMKNKSFLYDKDWNLTPSGQVWKDLVFGKWWTNAKSVSGENGEAAVAGFLGQYKITARAKGLEARAEAELKPGGTVVKLVLSATSPAQ